MRQAPASVPPQFRMVEMPAFSAVVADTVPIIVAVGVPALRTVSHRIVAASLLDTTTVVTPMGPFEDSRLTTFYT